MRTAAVPADTAERSGTTPSELIFQMWTASVSAGLNTLSGFAWLVIGAAQLRAGADWPAV